MGYLWRRLICWVLIHDWQRLKFHGKEPVTPPWWRCARCGENDARYYG